MRFHKKRQPTNGKTEAGHAMSEYIVVSLGLLLALLAAIDAVDLLIEHHDRASAAMQLPL